MRPVNEPSSSLAEVACIRLENKLSVIPRSSFFHRAWRDLQFIWSSEYGGIIPTRGISIILVYSTVLDLISLHSPAYIVLPVCRHIYGETMYNLSTMYSVFIPQIPKSDGEARRQKRLTDRRRCPQPLPIVWLGKENVHSIWYQSCLITHL